MSSFRNKLSNTMSGHLIGKKFVSLAEMISFCREVDTDVRVQSAKRKTQETRRQLTTVSRTTRQTTPAAASAPATKTTTTATTINPNSFSRRGQSPYAGLSKLSDKDRAEAMEKKLCFRCRKEGHIATNCPTAQVAEVEESASESEN